MIRKNDNMTQKIIENLKNRGMTDEQIISFLKELEMEMMILFSNSAGEPLGIPDTDYVYHAISQTQSREEEVKKTQEFLNILPSKVPNLINSTSDITFINYGDTELVYVIKNSDNKYALLVNQPTIPFGTVKIEYENLLLLAKNNPNLVIAPKAYISDEKKEAYITPYIKQARCIATYNEKYGRYIPEPYYRFEPYKEDDEYTICKIMIANLIRLYDMDRKLALADCRIGGGDFILEKEYDNQEHTESNTLKHMKLIAARKLINIELKDYINLIKKEFLKRTYYQTLLEKDLDILINQKNRVPMKTQAINDGINLGLKLKNM